MNDLILPGTTHGPGGSAIVDTSQAADRHPIWDNPRQKITLVENMKQPGLLGVALRGARFVCALPAGYDGLTQIHRMENGQVIVWHPGMSTLVCDFNAGTVAQTDIPPQLYFKDSRR